MFKIPGQNQSLNATSEYYEQLLNDPHVNKLKFSDDDPKHPNNPKSLNNPAPEYLLRDLSYWPPERFEAPEQSGTKTGPDHPDTNAASDQPNTVASPELSETLSQPVEPADQSNQASTPTTKKFDVRADVWSLGITLIEIVHGSVPYRDRKGLIPNNIILLQNLILTLDPIATVDEHLDGYTKEIKDFVKSCLKKVNDRPKYNDLMETPFYKNRETIDSEAIVKNLIEKHYPID
uniref:Protein kinase domain-containing protein n=1 Tax=Acrobeloides nanus TaxID=290746 RepID=A0A914C7P1_9BILA